MEDYNKDLEQRIAIGSMVKETINTKGWEHIQALLDRMIIDTIGGKDGDRWLTTPSKFSQSKNMEQKDISYLLGYRQGLADLNNYIHNAIIIAKEAREILANQTEDAYGNVS